MTLQEININELTINPMEMISKEWMLITAGNEKNSFNTMTAAWGHLGAIFDRQVQGKKIRGIPTATVYVRPHRYTKEFLDREPFFTLSFLGTAYKKQLAYLGARSGRDENKVAKTGLTPVFTKDTTFFSEANLVFICRKIYHSPSPLQEQGFIDKRLVEENYPQKDFHEVYIGEIMHVLKAK